MTARCICLVYLLWNKIHLLDSRRCLLYMTHTKCYFKFLLKRTKKKDF